MKQTFKWFLILEFLFCASMSIMGPTYVLFLQSKGLNLFEANFVNVVCFLTIFVFEIPTGVIADVFGRKRSFLISCLLLTIDSVIYGFSETMTGFIAAEILAAIALTCASGAFEAWAVDRLGEQGYNDQKTIALWGDRVARVAGILGGLAGGWLGAWNLAYPWFGTAAVAAVCGVFAFFFMEETPRKKIAGRLPEYLTHMQATLSAALAEVKQNQGIRFVLLMDGVFLFAVQGLNMHWSVFFSEWVGIEEMGVIKGAISVAMFVGTLLLGRFGAHQEGAKAFSETFLLLGLPLFLTVMTGSFWWALGGFLLHELGRGIYGPLKSAYLNEHIHSDDRATILSVVSMFRGLCGAIGLLVSGFIAEYASIRLSWTLSGITFLIFAFLYAKKSKI